MPELTPEIADAVAQACRTRADEAAEALVRALDTPLKLTVGDPQTISAAELPDDLAAGGLVVVLGTGPAAALLLPESTGLVPDWASDPDPTGKSKLTTLAQELGMLLLPEEFLVEQFDALYLKNLAEGLQQAGASESLGVVPLELTKEDGSQAEIRLIWPVSQAAILSQAAEEAPSAASTAQEAAPDVASATAPAPTAEKQPGAGQAAGRAAAPPFGAPTPAGPAGDAGRIGPAEEAQSPKELPTYARSLLRIEVPVMVTLADKRQSLSRILELGPGSIIQFDKSCEEPLCLEVGGRPVARGEAVKVGEKFGLRVTAMILPGERFRPVGTRKKSQNRPG